MYTSPTLPSTSTAAPVVQVKIPTSFPTKAARLAWFREALKVSDKWAQRAMLVIADYQTAAEQAAETTTEDNGVGFTGMDGKILMSFSKQIRAWDAATVKKFPTALSPKQAACVKKMMPKYAGQLIAHLEPTGKIPPVVKVKVAATSAQVG